MMLAEESVVFMIGPNSKWLRYAYDSAVALVPELDGVRILSRRGTEYLQRVPRTSPLTCSLLFSTGIANRSPS